MLHVNDLIYRIAGRPIFDRATVAVSDGQKVGLVGRNGSGKSTLLRLISGELQPDAGSIGVRSSARLGTVPQDPPGGSESVLDCVLAADRERSALLDEAETSTDAVRLAEIHHRLEDIAAAAAPARAGAILHGLGFDAAAQARPVGEFSGGWRMRVALAGTLFSDPDLLLLDEPSNHLDIEARLWLSEHLRRFRGTLVLVSHDRDLLNAVSTHTIHIEQLKLVAYVGNYDRFERTRRERMERQAAVNTRLLAQRRHMQAFVDRFRAKASKARQAQSRLKMLEKLEPVVPLVEDRGVEFDFPQPDRLSPPLITLENVAVGYAPERPVLQHLSLSLDMDDRIALLGQNGNGKSTLMRLLSDRLKPLSGSMRKSGKLRAGYFSQNQQDELDYAATPFELMVRLLPLAGETKQRAQLGRFGFSGKRADTRVGDLSGGEKTRLLFALMTRHAPHVLLLDEPTNHLDMDSRAALVEALNDYEGTVILVSHDAHLVRLVADRLWQVADGTCTPFEGDLEDYERMLLQGGREERPPERVAVPVAEPQSNRRDQRRMAASQRQRLAPLKRAIERAEKDMAELAKRRDAAEARLQDPALYSGPAQAIADAQKDKAWIERDLVAAEERWLEAQAAFEAAQAEEDAAAG
jgi:ATP-binding cassette subfamily F protein 3